MSNRGGEILADGSVKIKIDGDTNGFESKLKNIGSTAEKALSSAGKKLSSVGKKLTLGVTNPIVTAGTTSVKMATDFDSSLRKVSTIADTSVVSIEQLGAGTKELSKELGISATDLNEALYKTLSATNDTGNALSYLEQGAKLAIGGFTDTSTAIDGATSVLNAYGLKGSDAFKKIADNMVMTQNLGKTTVGELSASLYNVIPTASALGISFDEVSAAMATITSQGTPTSVATTQLRQMFVELSKESGQTAKTFKKLAGKSFSDFVASGGTVAQALKLMEDEAARNGVSLKDMFGSVEAGNAALQLTGNGAQKFAESLTAMQTSSGATEKAFTTMSESSGMQFEKLKSTLSTTAIEIGEKLLPVVLQIVDKIKGLVEWFSNLDEETQNNILKWAILAAAVGPALMIFGQVAQGISGIISLFSNLSNAASLVSSAFSFLLSPAGLVVMAIAAIIAIGVLLWKNWDKVKEFAIKIWNSIKDFFISVWNFLKDLAGSIWNGIKDIMSSVWNGIKSFTTDIWNSIKDFLVNTWNNLKNTVSDIWNKIKSVTFDVWNSIKNFLSGIWNSIKNFASQTWNTLKNIVSDVWNSIKNFTSNIWNNIKSFLSGTWNNIKNLVSNIWGGIKDFFSGLWNNIKSVAENTWNNLTSFFSNAWSNIVSGAQNAWNGLKDFFVNLWNNIKDAAWNGIQNIAGAIWNGFQSIISGVWDLGKQIVTGIWDGISSGASWLWDKLGGFFGGIIQKGKEILGIHSPSKEFAYLGQMSAIGYDEAMEKGMKDAKKHVEKDLNGLLQAARIKAKAVLNMAAPSSANSGMQGGTTTNYITNDKGITQNFYSKTVSPYDAYRRAALNAY